MTIPKLAQYALSAVVIILAGCGGLAQFPNPISQTSSTLVSADSSGNEVLSGTAKVHGSCGSVIDNKFVGSGMATGPYPGPFRTKGHWSLYHSPTRDFPWSFAESFTIKSGKTKIVGTISASGQGGGFIHCHTLGNILLHYATTSKPKHKGKVQITSIQQGDFNEALDGL
jgi:hypothetical protein